MTETGNVISLITGKPVDPENPVEAEIRRRLAESEAAPVTRREAPDFTDEDGLALLAWANDLVNSTDRAEQEAAKREIKALVSRMT